MRGAPVEPRVAMADASFSFISRTDTDLSGERTITGNGNTVTTGNGDTRFTGNRGTGITGRHCNRMFHAARWGWCWVMEPV